MSSARELHDLVAAWAPALPTEVDGNHDVVFSRGSVPPVPASLACDALVIEKRHHDYRSCRVDSLNVYARHETLRDWGLVLIAHLLADEPRATEIRLTHPDSDIRLLRLAEAGWTDGVLEMQPMAVDYLPARRNRYPWRTETSGARRPDNGVRHPVTFELTTLDETGGVNEAQRAERDTVVLSGQAPALAWFACLLLDIGLPGGDVDEYHLEPPALGFGGVDHGSAEARFWLPGSFGWMDLGLGDGPQSGAVAAR